MNKDPQKLAFYVRVSLTSQDYPSQLHALREFCRRSAWPVPPDERIFSEKAGGARVSRTQLDKLCQACRAGHVDAILVWQVNRIGRSFVHLVNLIAEFRRLKIRVIGIHDGMDTGAETPHSRKFLNDMMSAAEYQRELIVDSTVQGLSAARARGRVGGRRRMNDAKIARALKMRPKWKGSLRALAKSVGLDPGYLSRIFNGKRPKQ